MAQLFVNNGYSTLSAAINTGDTTLFIAAGHGSRFPVIDSPDFCYVTLEDASGNIEIVKVTAHSSGSTALTVARAQQGTTARAYAIGDLVELRSTAAEMTTWEADIDGLQASRVLKAGDSYTGAHDFSGASGVTLPAATSIGPVSATEIGYLDGLTSAIQSQLNAKADITGETYTGAHDFSGASSVTAPTKAPGSTGNHVATVDYANALSFASTLPGMTGNSLKVLRVNAGETSAEWALGLPAATSNEGKTLSLDSAAAPKWAKPPRTWSNWTLITSNGGTLTIPDLVNEIRAYTFGKGGDGSSSVGGGGGGGGGCTFGTIPCKPGDVFTFDNTSGAVLKKGATAYLSASNGSTGFGSTGGSGGAAGTVGSGLGITASGAYSGAAGANGNGSNLGGGGGSSGSPLGNGFAGTTGTGSGGGGGGGWGSSGSIYCGGGVGSYSGSDGVFTGSAAVDANSRPASRDWSNAFKDPLLRMCNGVAPILGTLSLGSEYTGNHGGAGCGGGSPRQSGDYAGGNGGLGGGGGPSRGNARAGHGGFGGGGGCCEQVQTGANAYAGNGGIGGGGGGAVGANKQGTGGSAAVVIFW